MNLLELLEAHQQTLMEASIIYNRWCGSRQSGTWAQSKLTWIRGKGWGVPQVLRPSIYSNIKMDDIPFYADVKFWSFSKGKLEAIVERGYQNAATAPPQA